MLLDSVLREADLSGKKALVLGTGGASVTVCAVLHRQGADVIPISRTGDNNYQNINQHADACLIVNTTPLGMFPNNGEKAVDLTFFPKLHAVLDVVYNPARTALLLQAEKLGIPHAGGLLMLVAQAKRSAELFLGKKLPDSELDRIVDLLSLQVRNLILIGMPGSGKSTVAALLAQRLQRPLCEVDAEIEKAAGITIPEIFHQEGESGFRKRETAVLAQLGKQSGLVISTGGGCVTRTENYPLLHQNGIIIRLVRDTDKLAREGRPLSLSTDLKQMEAVRNPYYEQFADITVDNNGCPQDTVDAILEALK